jgi:hypothetical protein
MVPLSGLGCEAIRTGCETFRGKKTTDARIDQPPYCACEAALRTPPHVPQQNQLYELKQDRDYNRTQAAQLDTQLWDLKHFYDIEKQQQQADGRKRAAAADAAGMVRCNSKGGSGVYLTSHLA